MSFYAEFLMRVLKSKYNFSYNKNGLEIKLANPETLRDVTIAMPKTGLQLPQMPGLSVDRTITITI